MFFCILGEYFGRSCVPGALDYDYNRLKTNPRALCLKCYSKGSDYCSRSQREMFYGSSGAFRCLTEGIKRKKTSILYLYLYV